jgi:Protein of unknown function (DUF433)
MPLEQFFFSEFGCDYATILAQMTCGERLFTGTGMIQVRGLWLFSTPLSKTAYQPPAPAAGSEGLAVPTEFSPFASGEVLRYGDEVSPGCLAAGARAKGRYSMKTALKGVIHGKVIELDEEPGLPDGQPVSIELRPIEEPNKARRADAIPPVETWKDRLVYDSAIDPLERIVKGTRLQAEALVAELDSGCSDEYLLQAHPELTAEDVQALRNYAKWPVGLRRSFGAWAEEAKELDEYLEWTRQQRKIERRGIEE